MASQIVNHIKPMTQAQETLIDVKKIDTMEEFVKALGGTFKAAEAFGCSPSYMSDMKKNGTVSKSRRLRAYKLAEARGWKLSDHLVGED